MFLLYDLIAKFRLENQRMISNLKPLLILTQANQVKQKDKNLFKFFINLSNSVQLS